MNAHADTIQAKNATTFFAFSFIPNRPLDRKKIIKSMKMAFGIALQNNLDKVYARLQNSLFSFSSITPIKKYYVILGQVSRNTLQSIT